MNAVTELPKPVAPEQTAPAGERKTPVRTYLLSRKSATEPQRRLVKTHSEAAALRHVAQDEWGCSVATQDDLEQLLPAGVQVERPAG